MDLVSVRRLESSDKKKKLNKLTTTVALDSNRYLERVQQYQDLLRSTKRLKKHRPSFEASNTSLNRHLLKNVAPIHLKLPIVNKKESP